MLLLIQGNTRSTLNDFLQIQQQIIFTFFFLTDENKCKECICVELHE